MAWENILSDVTNGVATITQNRNDARKGFCSGGDMTSAIPDGPGLGDMLGNGIKTTINPMPVFAGQ